MEAAYVAAITGLVGAAIGSASSIAAMVVQSRYRDRRDRSKQVTDLALAEFKAALDLAASGKGPSTVLPLVAYAFNTSQMIAALEDGSLTPEKWREINQANDKMYRSILESEKEIRAKRSGS